MSYLVKMPKLGMEMEEGTVLEWRCDEGDRVTEEAVVAEIESEKATAEVLAREDGILRRILVPVGETVPTGAAIGVVAAADESIDDLLARAETSGPDGIAEREDATTSETDQGVDSPTGPSPDGTKVTPRARKLAAEHDVDTDRIEATGFEGSVSGADVLRTVDVGDRVPDSPSTGLTVREERPFDGVRQTIADRLGRSQAESAHVTVHRNVDAEPLLTAAKAAERAFEEGISVIDLLVEATSRTLEANPRFNGAVEQDQLDLYEEHNIGIAVDTDRGLLSPVIDDVQAKSLREIATAHRRLVDDARSGSLPPDALAGGTFTITNLGAFGVDSFTPIINPPQVAILGVDAIEERPVVDDGTVEVKHVIGFDLTFDHRAVDGADAARFLDDLATAVEDAPAFLSEGTGEPEGQGADDASTERFVTVETEGGLSGRIASGSFEWSVDEPVDVGGGGTAPSPVDQFLGSLGSCLAISIGMQARKQDVDLACVEIDVDASPVHGHVSEIDVTIDVTPSGKVDADTMDELIDRGKRACYVTNLLREELDITYTPVD